MTEAIRIETSPIPVVDIPPTPPPLPTALYRTRIDKACAMSKRAGLDFLAVYADREHCANLEYLTGFDPRFEEALLLLSVDGRAKLLVGNECMGYTPEPALGIEIELFQEFSLLGQSRGQSRPLRTIVSDFGIQSGRNVGAVGWKYFESALVADGAMEVPAFLIDLLRELCGTACVRNAAALFMNAQNGLRTVNEPEQIAHFEYAANVTASGVLDLLTHMKVGAAECELERKLDSRGLPLSCHRMISFGDKARRGLSSASTNRIRVGDPYTVAFGVTGGLTCRAGSASHGPDELPDDLREFYSLFAANYFAVAATWYESVRVGIGGREVFNAVNAVRDDRLFRFAVNPGHQLHSDEWVNSPFSAESPCTLTSGMALQVDIIPVSAGPFCSINAEDGVLLADENLQASIATAMPALWERVQRRRRWIHERMGIRLHESVLPLSDLTAWLPPYAMDVSRIFVKGR